MEAAIALDAEVYAHLRALAARVIAGKGSGRAVEPTELLHEAWMKLARTTTMFKDRGHFFAVAALAMRQILVNQAQAHNAWKRGGGARQTTVSGLADGARSIDAIELDDALNKLAAVDPAAAETATLRLFGGLTVEEVAAATGASARTVARKWRFGRAFLEQTLVAPA